MSDIDWSTYSTADLIEAYSILKSDIETAEAQFKAKIKTSAEGLKNIHTQIKMRMNASGVNQLAVKGFGTAFYTTNTYYGASDWGKFCEHIIKRIEDGDNIISILSAFQKKPNKEYIVAWMEGHEGVPPPGVSVNSETELQVRRSN